MQQLNNSEQGTSIYISPRTVSSWHLYGITPRGGIERQERTDDGQNDKRQSKLFTVL